ncbi:MAG: polyprenyl synthetase family protein [Gammaproteobacteria bacterium]|nr:polyprenyl synthetase family protein [Gammaproteobacteria bacterium]MDE0251394.1 polyprenyl synthetase family protein [Gammaproteobacteria bacterium]MDE0401923.1 polyprenyl synthetase family protein [Gammaproteobacteria bacterium]
MNQLATFRSQIEERLGSVMDLNSPHSTELVAAMRYAVLGGGKRLRGILVCGTTSDLGGESARALTPAVAVELIHAYSLVHDDLPDMDNSDLRRGKPSCHAKFGSTTAILVGDALQTLAFTTIAQDQQISDSQRVQCLYLLGDASGWRQMVGGQAMDMELEQQLEFSERDYVLLCEAKTAALFRASIEMGAVIAGINHGSANFNLLSQFGNDLGLAFQITDDLLDHTESSSDIGKPAGADAVAGKKNAVAVFGVDEARNRANHYFDRCMEALENIPYEMRFVKDLTRACVHRNK